MARWESGYIGTAPVLIQFPPIPGFTPFTFTRTLTLGWEASVSTTSRHTAPFIRSGSSREIRQRGRLQCHPTRRQPCRPVRLMRHRYFSKACPWNIQNCMPTPPATLSYRRVPIPLPQHSRKHPRRSVGRSNERFLTWGVASSFGCPRFHPRLNDDSHVFTFHRQRRDIACNCVRCEWNQRPPVHSKPVNRS